jgi:prepilin-type N-terminal cleavage/methylation domain-containing protein
MITRYRNTGFTLLELVVVIVIIALLAVFLTPTFTRCGEPARRTSCGQNMGQIHKAMTMYEVDYSAYPAVAKCKLAYTEKPQDALNLLYRQYIDDVRVYSCPEKKMTTAQLEAVSVSSANFSGSLVSSYGYSPGHTSANSRVIILADKRGANANSDNHGKNAGQNELSAGGSISYIPRLANGSPPQNDLGKNDNAAQIIDPSIYFYGDLPLYPEWDSGCL